MQYIFKTPKPGSVITMMPIKPIDTASHLQNPTFSLKKIIEKYADRDFIYRKKVGLNSSFEDWVCTNENKSFLKDLLTEHNGISEVMMGKRNLNLLLKHFMSEKPVHPNVSRLVINLAISQSWVKKHGLTID